MFGMDVRGTFALDRTSGYEPLSWYDSDSESTSPKSVIIRSIPGWHGLGCSSSMWGR
jgi:hypothetical protein